VRFQGGGGAAMLLANLGRPITDCSERDRKSSTPEDHDEQHREEELGQTKAWRFQLPRTGPRMRWGLGREADSKTASNSGTFRQRSARFELLRNLPVQRHQVPAARRLVDRVRRLASRSRSRRSREGPA
jgi:hypothetical protein